MNGHDTGLAKDLQKILIVLLVHDTICVSTEMRFAVACALPV